MDSCGLNALHIPYLPALLHARCYTPAVKLAGIPYEVTVWTSDVSGAGTDANVFLQMYGEEGKTEEYPIRNRTDNFEQAQVDKFKVRS